MKAITCFSRHATARLQPRGLRRRSQTVHQVRDHYDTGEDDIHALCFPDHACRLQEGSPKARVHHVELLQKGIHAERTSGLANVQGVKQRFGSFHVSHHHLHAAEHLAPPGQALHHMRGQNLL